MRTPKGLFLKALKYYCINYGDQRGFQFEIITNIIRRCQFSKLEKSLFLQVSSHKNNLFMKYRHSNNNLLLILLMNTHLFLNNMIYIDKPLERGDRLCSSKYDVYRRHILTTKVDPRTVRVQIFIMAVYP